MMEFIDIVDENGNPTGRIANRSEVHKKGLKHRTSHVWILRRKSGTVEVLLQKRSDTKDSFPGCYDISSAGHIPAGMSFKESALRELNEELGLVVQEDELIDCGIIRINHTDIFYGQPFKDDQVSAVFYIWKDVNENDFILQEEELSSVMWINLKKCKEMIYNNTIVHCIIPEELELLPVE